MIPGIIDINVVGLSYVLVLHLVYAAAVAMARSLYPLEARLAMQIAHADSTLEFGGLSTSKGSYGNFREVDLNEIPSEQVKKLQQRLQALQKTGNCVTCLMFSASIHDTP